MAAVTKMREDEAALRKAHILIGGNGSRALQASGSKLKIQRTGVQLPRCRAVAPKMLPAR